nr:MAG TPA: hypothetical protein [Caudoviricetes sp.]
MQQKIIATAIVIIVPFYFMHFLSNLNAQRPNKRRSRR